MFTLWYLFTLLHDLSEFERNQTADKEEQTAEILDEMKDSGDQIGADLFSGTLKGIVTSIDENSESFSETNLGVDEELPDQADINFNYFPDGQIETNGVENSLETFQIPDISVNDENSESFDKTKSANGDEKSGQTGQNSKNRDERDDKFDKTNFPTSDDEKAKLNELKSSKSEENSDLPNQTDINFNYFPDAQIGTNQVENSLGKFQIPDITAHDDIFECFDKPNPANGNEKTGQTGQKSKKPDKCDDVKCKRFNKTNFPASDEKNAKLNELKASKSEEISDLPGQTDNNFNYFPDAQIGMNQNKNSFGMFQITDITAYDENSESFDKTTPSNGDEKSGQTGQNSEKSDKSDDVKCKKFNKTNFPASDDKNTNLINELQAYKSEKISDLPIKNEAISKKPPIGPKTRNVCNCGSLGPRYVKECRCKSKKNNV